MLGKDPKRLAIEPDHTRDLTREQRRRGCHRSAPEHAISKFGRARERMRPTARAADNQEPLKTKCIGHGGNIARGVPHPPPRQSGRISVARPVDRDHMQTQTWPQRRVGMSTQPAARTPMEEEHRQTTEITPPLVSHETIMLDRNSPHRAAGR
jgi:hypothetical protein